MTLSYRADSNANLDRQKEIRYLPTTEQMLMWTRINNIRDLGNSSSLNNTLPASMLLRGNWRRQLLVVLSKQCNGSTWKQGLSESEVMSFLYYCEAQVQIGQVQLKSRSNLILSFSLS